MTDLSILRKNFNKLIDSYEEQDVTIEKINERSMGAKLYAAMVAEHVEQNVLKGTLDDSSNEFINDLIKSGINVGFSDFLADLTRENFVEEQNEQGTVKE